MNNFFGINFWGFLSAGLVLASGIPYMKQIYTRDIKRPVTSTWLLWFGIGVLLFFTNFDAGAKWSTTLPPMFIGMTNPFIIVYLSWRSGEYKWTALDVMCVLICIITIYIWQTTESPVLGIAGGVIADAIAMAPLFIKCWTEPEDEPVYPWAMFVLASLVGLLAIEKWEIRFWMSPVWMCVGSSLLLLPLVLHKFRRVGAKQIAPP